jgi:inorganic pyrophosphatase
MKHQVENNPYKLKAYKYKAHPWHGVDIGPNAPDLITSYIEMVPTDTVKYEVDKETGFLRIDRPQKYSNVVPALYGFIPQTYSGKHVAELTMSKTGRTGIKGDGDPLDICILTEKDIHHGDILVKCRLIGGFRMLDGDEADDKLIAVLFGDAVYGDYEDIHDVAALVIDRLKHYFLTYKDLPGNKANTVITHLLDKDEVHDLIRRSMHDYNETFIVNNKVMSSATL